LKTDRLPGVLRIAAESVELDYVKIVHTNDPCHNVKTISTLNLIGWEERLHKKCVNKINNDIIKYNKYNENGNFYVHANQLVSRFYSKYLFYKCVDLYYTIDTDFRGIKLRKIKKIINGKKRRLE